MEVEDKGEKLGILIAEDHVILRDGLKHILNGVPGWEVVGEAGDGLDAVRLTEELKPDLVLMDLSMPRMNGLEAIQELRKKVTDIKILVLTVHKTEEYILGTLKAGADGYAIKDTNETELISAIKQVMNGQRYLDPLINEKVIEGCPHGRKSIKGSVSWDSLTAREREILKMLAEGYKNSDIADYLQVSTKTVGRYRANLMKKLDLHSASSLTAYAIEKGLVTR